MKKLASLILALVMVLAMTVPAMAEGETTYTLTLNNAIAGHTYTAYQIFAGDLSGDTLSNIVWGSGVTEAGKTALGKAAEKAESLKSTEDAEAFAAAVASYLGTAAGSTTIAEGATTGTISGLEAGYYLVKTTAVTGENGVYTYYIMKVVKDTTANIKADAPEVEKSVNDNDANIGDTVIFTLTATMPSNIQGYETYKVVFHDTLSAGLKYTNYVKVTIDGDEIEEKTAATADTGEKVNYVVTHNDGELTISFADVLTLGAKESSKIVVTYTAVVDEDAVIGTAGNPNKVYLEYSNDPNWDGTGDEPTGDTPEDEVKVYTWEIPVFKYTGTSTPLAGAGFTLYKDADCIEVVYLVATETANVYKVCTLTDCTHTHVTEVVTDSTGKFEIEGLEKGIYYLKETTTPAGYNTCAEVTVVIGENGALTQNDSTTTEVAIENKAGSLLPETGGMGTTLIYAAGALLVAAAAVIMISKRRREA